MDLVGPLPPSNGFTYLLTVVDRFTRWPEAIPLSNTITHTCAQALVTLWIARFGVPMDMSSDRGSQFTSQLWASISKLLGTKLHHTTAYHPQSNGPVERFHRHHKSALHARLSGPNWSDELPLVLLGIRTAPKEDLGCSSAELVYGTPLTIAGDFIANHGHQSDHSLQLQRLRDRVGSLASVPTSRHGTAPVSVPADLQRAKFVFVRCDAHRTSLQRPYEGPFRVIETDPKTFKIDIGGKTETITVDRLKLAHLDVDSPVQLAQPRPRGCPPAKQSDPAPKPSVPQLPQCASKGRPIRPKQTTTPSTTIRLPQSTRSGRQVRPNRRYISVLWGSCSGQYTDTLSNLMFCTLDLYVYVN